MKKDHLRGKSSGNDGTEYEKEAKLGFHPTRAGEVNKIKTKYDQSVFNES
jgi:hypothetical protein